MSGFDDSYSPELKGKIHPLDFANIMYRFNYQIEVFYGAFIQFQVTNIITLVICVILFILSILKITDQWLNLEITGAIGLLGVVGMFAYIISGNKKILKSCEDFALELTNRSNTWLDFELLQ
ncbi:hypothetical protein PPL_08312 [Heterostelium album PN500]|uniref:Uncharacterized protein n=1 Tax=Heterostelium pallidum (strain ATCC 26659 / Pp 5 / PN500) TaxID=670386 RepID=D3BHU7_HETP5|nr:hypothetical protein PPL_08312 [Heterostelium album PN500]EFA78847.1 hypothetical protein PPL_08312 [Heterostelium album PN500]|eukprot:XP_020430971.1 hypothetical protein PPL_08312 [Heterostelium album PN500]